MSQIKIGVSEWKFILDDGTIYELPDEVSNEKISCSPCGKYSIVLQVPTYHKEDWDDILLSGTIKEIRQRFVLMNNLGEKLDPIEISYMDAKVVNTKQESKTGDAAKFSIALKNNKKK